MSKCQVCNAAQADSAFQPFGPSDTPHISMTELGSHYRGFPVIKVCGTCHDNLGRGLPMEFEYKGQRYITTHGDTFLVPGYVADALWWLEENYELLKGQTS